MAPSISIHHATTDFNTLENDLKNVPSMNKPALDWFAKRIDELRAQLIEYLLIPAIPPKTGDKISDMLFKMSEFKEAGKARRLVIIAEDEEIEKKQKEEEEKEKGKGKERRKEADDYRGRGSHLVPFDTA
ncbi:Ubiquitin conjugation factor E4 [Hypoxylon texense]